MDAQESSSAQPNVVSSESSESDVRTTSLVSEVFSIRQKILNTGDLLRHKKTPLLFICFGALICAGCIAFFYATPHDRHVAVKQFTHVYSLVPEKISKSASIPISLPEGVVEDVARASITFSPEIQGTWQTEAMEGIILFKPKKPLRTKMYYAVNMDTGSVQMSGDFYVDEDPQIEAIFPVSSSEAHNELRHTLLTL